LVVNTRRAFVRTAGAGAAGGAAIWLGACGATGSKHHQPRARGPTPIIDGADIGILNRALDLEHVAIAAYTAGTPLLAGSAMAAAQQFLGQELSHAAELSALIELAEGKAHTPSSSYDLGHPRNATEVLDLLHTLESAMITFYIDAIPKLSSGSVRATMASILASEAQHVSLVRVALGNTPVPGPFVSGRE
jgi:Ferritin-like domain